MALSLDISKNPVDEGKPFSLTASGDGTYVTYEFFKNDKSVQKGGSSDYKVTAATKSDAGRYHCIGTTSTGEEKSPDVVLVVNAAVIPIEDAPNYIHPLSVRNTAFLWLGWWVINEIQRAKELGLDWKTEFDKLNYSNDLETLAIMFENYETVEVQESRNGYVLDKDAIEAGYFY